MLNYPPSETSACFEKLEMNNSFSEFKKLYFNVLSKNSVMGQIFYVIINMREEDIGTVFLDVHPLLNVKSF